MKRTFITTGIIVAVTVIALVIFNKLTSKKDKAEIYTQALQGKFEISISAAGELLAENSIDILGPDFVQAAQNSGPGNRGGGRGGSGGGGFHLSDFKIQDIVAEGTIVKKGDYIAQLDRSSYDNMLKDAEENLKTLQTNVDMKILDTAMTLTSLRDDIKNQRFTVEEASITLDQSKYEPPATIRQAEISLDKAQRGLEQKLKAYNLVVAQTKTDINHEKMHLQDGKDLVNSLENFLSQFTIRAPADGMLTYYKDRLGIKRKVGSNVNPFDRIIATLPDLSSIISKTYVSEIEVNKVHPGEKVEIKVDALPDKAFSGIVKSVANVGEQLPNSDAKMFEVLIKFDGTDPAVRPSMTTGNKIIIKTFDNVVYIPTECVHTGPDSIPYVYTRNKAKQFVIVGDFNDKNIIVEQGLNPGTSVYLATPENAETFRETNKDLIPVIRDRERERRIANNAY
jgi:multidrug efflux pump subunit AcrA (membrane-fusion protein)